MRPPWIRVTSASTWLLSCAAKRSSTSIPTTAAAVAPGTRADAIRYKALSKVANSGGATAPLAVCERGSRAGSSSTCTGRERRETIAPCALTTANRSGCGESTAPAARKARSSGRPGDWPSPPRTASIRSGIIATARGARRASSRSICPSRAEGRARLERASGAGEERMARQGSRGIDLAGGHSLVVGGRILADEVPAGRARLHHVSPDRLGEQTIGDARGQAAVEELGLEGGQREPAEEAVPDLALAQQDRSAECGVVARPAEALRPEQIRRPRFPKPCADGLRTRQRVREDAADHDPETVSAQVPGPELVAVPGGREDPETLPLDRQRLVGRRFRAHADPLHGQRPPVLESGGADVALTRPERPRDLGSHFGCRASPLLHGQIQVLASAGGLVQGQFLDGEVLLCHAKQSGSPRQIGSEQGNGTRREQVGQSCRRPRSISAYAALVASNSPSAVARARSAIVRVPSASAST